MLYVRHTANDMKVARTPVTRTVVKRDPALINLPIPLPSIPILTPLLSPVVGGSNSGSNNGASNPPPAPNPSPTPSAPNNGGGNGNGGGNSGTNSGANGGGNSGGNDGATDNGGGGGGGQTDPGTGGTTQPPASGGSDTPGSNTPDSGQGSTPSTPSNPATGGGTNNNDGTPTTGSSNGTSSGGSGGQPSSLVDVGGSSSGGSSSSSPNSVNGSPAANAGGDPSNTSGSTGSGRGGTATTGGRSTTSGIYGPSSSGNGSDGSGPNITGTNGAQDNTKSHLSTGAVAGIVILLLLLLLGLVIFILRRRNRNRRNARANTWWFARKRSSQNYGDSESAVIVPRPKSSRSSFATTFENRSDSPVGPALLPPLPPMAELGRPNASDPALYFGTRTPERRQSGTSVHSENSQFLVVHHRDSIQVNGVTPPASSASEARFSNSQSFAFPKPPTPGDRSSSRPGSSRPTSSSTVLRSPPSTLFYPQSPTVIITTSPNDPFADDNPFSDPFATHEQSTIPFAQLSPFEIIRRPFKGSRDDELEVIPDERVRVLKSFDDGWAMVQKVDCEGILVELYGLIPIDCFREPGQQLTEFFREKRVSLSYSDHTQTDFSYTAI